MTDEALVPVFGSDDEVEVNLYQTLLEEAGIPTVLRDFADIWGQRTRVFSAEPPARLALFVRERDVDQARLLVEDFRQQADAGALEVREDDTPPPVDEAHVRGTRKTEILFIIIVVLILLVFVLLFTIRLYGMHISWPWEMPNRIQPMQRFG